MLAGCGTVESWAALSCQDESFNENIRPQFALSITERIDVSGVGSRRLSHRGIGGASAFLKILPEEPKGGDAQSALSNRSHDSPECPAVLAYLSDKVRLFAAVFAFVIICGSGLFIGVYLCRLVEHPTQRTVRNWCGLLGCLCGTGALLWAWLIL